jgi:hypothetical protein
VGLRSHPRGERRREVFNVVETKVQRIDPETCINHIKLEAETIYKYKAKSQTHFQVWAFQNLGSASAGDSMWACIVIPGVSGGRRYSML